MMSLLGGGKVRPVRGGKGFTPVDVAEPKKPTGKPMAGSMTPEALFAHTHGGPFDPKSSMDKKKMAAISSMLSKEGSGDLTPNQFALKIYRQK
jgi:hypothetical protein